MSSPANPLKRTAADLAASDAKKPKANGSITSFFGAPKPVTAAASSPAAVKPLSTSASSGNNTVAASGTTPAVKATPASKFDKDAWVAKLTDDQRDLLKLEIDTLHESWLQHLTSELTSESFLGLKRFLRDEAKKGVKIFPPLPDVYSWSRHTPLPTVRAVILGQDPYHNNNQAHGLCFSVRPPTPAPPSLKNMYTALKKDYPNFQPPLNNAGLLTPWADHGVLLLNTCLTVEAHRANSHAGKGWERFTQKVIEVVARERRKGVVFLAWGTPAQKRCTNLGPGVPSARHVVLKSVHPSPLSAARGFFDCGHFKKANEWLRERYGAEGEIDWNLNVKPEAAGV